ncbi:chemotaxis protein CheB [uncultured Thiodictyon sp.]|uniref:chemotaxis protein CheB n=1 Tax=uncultured Thiodictyon sp. TaxID=1846217 RepID=UPI0026014852|nr:chemotaxis protein CheB [uncultured Thiodictyon sp.]
MPALHTRDIVVIGASMGGVEALRALARGFPADLPASVLVVLHTSSGQLADFLDRAGPLRATTAEDGIAPQRGRIYVAPPGRHLLLTGEGLRVVFGPRENSARPAVDPLFRTAAASHRSRVIGVVLTGCLDDGAAGLLAVHRCGGCAVVQAPDDAAYPEMPRRALLAVPDAITAQLSDLAPLLARLAAQPAPVASSVPAALLLETQLWSSISPDGPS